MMSAGTRQGDPVFPLEFEPEMYKGRYSDLRRLRGVELESHYRNIGISTGRCGSSIAERSDFVKLLDRIPSILEIGPFANPAIRGKTVKYFDVLDTDGLKRRAESLKLNPRNCPQVDFVSESGDLGIVNEQFDAVFSSHVIEHQPDLLSHLLGIAKLLKPQGRYFLAIPDKRYCFDHFIAESSVADVIAAHVRKPRVHDVGSLVEHFALTTHNDPLRHWSGDHGEPLYKNKPQQIHSAVLEYFLNDGKYVDTHAWQFVPSSFREIARLLHALQLSALDVERVYPTLRNSNEFYAILVKAEKETVALAGQLPKDFDTDLYLRANPDVAKAGADARRHYLLHGRREGRKLRPDN